MHYFTVLHTEGTNTSSFGCNNIKKMMVKEVKWSSSHQLQLRPDFLVASIAAGVLVYHGSRSSFSDKLFHYK